MDINDYFNDNNESNEDSTEAALQSFLRGETDKLPELTDQFLATITENIKQLPLPIFIAAGNEVAGILILSQLVGDKNSEEAAAQILSIFNDDAKRRLEEDADNPTAQAVLKILKQREENN